MSGNRGKSEYERNQEADATIPLTDDDAIWNIVGLGDTDVPTNMAENIDEHLVRAYRADVGDAE